MSEPIDRATQDVGRVARKGAIWSFLAQATVALSSVLTFALLGRIVGPENYGEYVFAMLLLAGVQWLSLNAYKEPVIQAPRLSEQEASSAFWFTCGVGILLAAIMLAVAAYLNATTQRFALATCVAILSMKVLADAVAAVPLAMRARQLDFRFISLNAAFAGIMLSAFAIALLYLGYGIRGMAIGQAMGALAGCAVPLIYARWRPRWHFAWRDLGVLRRYSPHVLTWQAVEMINACFDRFFVGTRLSVGALGLYGFARRLNEVVIEVLVGGVSNVALPAFASIQEDKARLRSAFLRSVRVVTFIVLPVIGMLFVSAEQIVLLVFGERWLPAVPVYRCFLLLGVIQTVGIIQAAMIRSLGQTSVWSTYMVLQTIGNVLVVFAFISSGILWLAFALVAKTYAIWWWSVVMTCRLLDMSLRAYLVELARPLLCSLIAAAAAYGAIVALSGDASILHTAALLSISGALYLAIAHTLNRAGFAEVRGLLRRA